MLIRIWYNYAAPAPAGLLFGALAHSVRRAAGRQLIGPLTTTIIPMTKTATAGPGICGDIN